MSMEVKYVGIGGSGMNYPCYEDDYTLIQISEEVN